MCPWKPEVSLGCHYPETICRVLLRQGLSLEPGIYQVGQTGCPGVPRDPPPKCRYCGCSPPHLGDGGQTPVLRFPLWTPYQQGRLLSFHTEILTLLRTQSFSCCLQFRSLLFTHTHKETRQCLKAFSERFNTLSETVILLCTPWAPSLGLLVAPH